MYRRYSGKIKENGGAELRKVETGFERVTYQRKKITSDSQGIVIERKGLTRVFAGGTLVRENAAPLGFRLSEAANQSAYRGGTMATTQNNRFQSKQNAASIIPLLRPVNLGKSPESLFSEPGISMFRQCTFMAEIAQSYADIRGRDQESQLAREVVKLAADCKLSLAALMTKRLTQEKLDELGRRAVSDYSRLKEKVAELFPMLNCHWGCTIPQLL